MAGDQGIGSLQRIRQDLHTAWYNCGTFAEHLEEV